MPLGVYVVSYIPWALVEDHQLIPGWPPGHTGRRLLDLTGQMYRYHNGLTAAHPASSPWWAWPLNLKPVWFYQEGLAAGTARGALRRRAASSSGGSASRRMAFVACMAFKRRSLALTLIAIGFAAQWIPWARIDRAAFQYHYYTALPFLVSPWPTSSPSSGTARRARPGCWPGSRPRLAIMGPALLWLLDRPLCAFVGVESVNPGSAACPAVIPTAS